MNDSIRTLPGIGERRAGLYAKLGIESVGDLLRHFPRAYQNRGQIKTLREVKDGEICPVIATLATDPSVTPPLKNRIVLLKFRIFDDTGSATVVFFQQSYLKNVFRVGMTFRFFGKFHLRMGAIELSSPQFEPLLPGARLPDYLPVYPLTEGLSQKMIAAAVSAALSRLADRHEPLPDPLPAHIRDKRGLPSLAEALRMIHRPRDEEEIRRARQRFVFESLYLFSLGVAGMRKSRSELPPPPLAPVDLAPFLDALPFAMTADQLGCVRDIARDLSPDARRPMARLISGDVGSGKTAVAAAAIYLCVKGGRQAMLMAPTEILAVQHAKELAPLFASLGIRTELLTGSTRASEKRRIRSALASGEADVVIGTHALLSEGVSPARIGLVVTDEQHRFGVGQRAKLASGGGGAPHVLVMSATPIPRTLALILYGDLDVSTIETLPPGRQKVDTFVVGEGYRERLNAFIRRLVGEGGQVYIVCPAIEEPPAEEEEFACGSFLNFSGEQVTLGFDEMDRTPPLHYAVSHSETVRALFPDLRVACLHGRMKGAEKDAVMQAFAAGETDILVSTTVIEVGVNVPNACLMLVENAERFGLSQLHQLRGRVGRGKRKSYCVLVSDAKGEGAGQRLSVLRTNHSGFAIAQEDLKLRGPGDFFLRSDGSARQSGEFSIGLASLCTDMDELRDATDAAAEVIAADPHLEHPDNRPARDAMEAMFAEGRQGIS